MLLVTQPGVEVGRDVTRLGNVTLQIVRDCVVRFNAEGLDGLRDRKAPGRTPLLNAAHRAALLEIIERGQTRSIHGVVRCRTTDLGQWLWEEFQIPVSPRTLSRVLREKRLRKLSARPKHYAQAERAIAAFKKTSPPRWQVSRWTKGSGPRLSISGSPMRPG